MNMSLFDEHEATAHVAKTVSSNGLITVFARKEPTDDATAKKYYGKKDLDKLADVVFYRDDRLTKPFARWMWFNKPPRKGTKRVTLNCWNWSVLWVH